MANNAHLIEKRTNLEDYHTMHAVAENEVILHDLQGPRLGFSMGLSLLEFCAIFLKLCLLFNFLHPRVYAFLEGRSAEGATMNEGPRYAVITNDDHGPLLAMSAWFLGCTLVLCTATRIAVRFSMRHVPTADDFLILAAAAFAVSGIIAISFAVDSGLGKRLFLVNPARINNVQKEIYTSTIFYVLTVGFSKLSVTVFLTRLACTPIHKTAVLLLGIVVVSWTTAITGVVAFPCKLPRPWDYSGEFRGECIPILPFWIAASILDIATDVIMILLPVNIVYSLQLQTRKKAIVIFIFTLRILLIVLSLVRFTFFTTTFSPTSDRFFDTIPHFILTQTHAALSVIIACSPALKPFIESVRTGMLSASLAKHRTGTTFGQDSWNMQTHSARSKTKRMSTKRMLRLGSNSVRSGITKSRPWRYVSDERGKIIAMPAPASANTTKTTNTAVEMEEDPRPDSISTTSTYKTWSPHRPPPPPEELRPDLSMFGPRCLLGHTTTAIVSDGMKEDGSRKTSDESERRSGVGSGSRSSGAWGFIKQTTTWDVRFDDADAAWV